MSPSPTSTIDPSEIEKFSKLAETWWDPEGPFKPLHQLNPIRISYIRETLYRYFSPSSDLTSSLSNLTLLDVGCGGGLLAEPFARLGASVTGIDASDKNIAIAKSHAEQSRLSIEYLSTTVESLAQEEKKYDAVFAMEIIEHVAEIPSFIAACRQVLKPGGVLFMSTLNRTFRAYLLAIIGAEYLLRWLPKGTHEWSRFMTPAELTQLLYANHLSVQEIKGIVFQPLRRKWQLSHDCSVNYVLHATAPLPSSSFIAD